MIKIDEKKECNGCTSCLNICPKEAITMKSDKEGFLYPYVNNEKCINCGLCVNTCPIRSNSTKTISKIKAFACKNEDEKIRKESSSGGIFSLLCEEVISKNGVVFGAMYDEEFSVYHDYVDTIEDCYKLRGSKYVQSRIGSSFKKVKEFLDENKLVLFSGTPCQVAGLYFYLKKDYNNLLLVDIACHGSPSPLVYKKYLNNLESKNNSKIKNIYFREKSTGWKKYSFKVEYDNKSVSQIGYENIYMKGFLRDIYLRPSCYDCKFKKPVTYADLTLADYWGIENIKPEFDDDKGTSLILVNSLKGESYFNNISKKMSLINTSYDEAIRFNPSIIKSSVYEKQRDKFFKELEKRNIEELINKYTKYTLYDKLRAKIKRIFN